MLLDIIKKRRSIFPAQYNEKEITKSTIAKVLEAANWAPSHRKTEPWRFKVLQGAAKTRLGLFLSQTYSQEEPSPKMMKVKKLEENPKRAGTIIAVCMQRDPKERVPEWEEVAAVAMAVQNMWLVCSDMGIGAYWSSPSLITQMGNFFDLEEGEKCLGFFYMGYYDMELPVGFRNPIEAKTQWISE